MPFGKFGRYPFKFGGGKPVQRTARDAMLTALSPSPGTGYDVNDPGLRSEVSAHAGVVSNIWRINGRVKNSALPTRAIDSVQESEAILNITPSPDQSDNERRAVIAAKTKAFGKNDKPAIEAAVREIAGNQFVGLFTASEDETWVYWAAGNPGFPGLEWASNRNHIQISLTKAGLPDDASFERMRAAISNLLHSQLPASHTFSINTGTGFIVGESLIGESTV